MAQLRFFAVERAEVYRLIIVRIPELGGPSGRPLGALADIDPALRGAAR